MWYRLAGFCLANAQYGYGYPSDATTIAAAEAQTYQYTPYAAATAASAVSGRGYVEANGLRPVSTVLLAHIVCGALATLLFLPLGAIIPRIARIFTTRPWWLPAHAMGLGFIGGGLVIAAYAISQRFYRAPSFDTAHQRMGLAMLILMIVQSCLGSVVLHWVKAPLRNASGRTPLNYLHIILGIATVIFGWFTAWTGIWQELELHNLIKPGWNRWRTGWVVVVVLWFILCIGAWTISAVHKPREQDGKVGSGDNLVSTPESDDTSPI